MLCHHLHRPPQLCFKAIFKLQEATKLKQKFKYHIFKKSRMVANKTSHKQLKIRSVFKEMFRSHLISVNNHLLFNFAIDFSMETLKKSNIEGRKLHFVSRNNAKLLNTTKLCFKILSLSFLLVSFSESNVLGGTLTSQWKWEFNLTMCSKQFGDNRFMFAFKIRVWFLKILLLQRSRMIGKDDGCVIRSSLLNLLCEINSMVESFRSQMWTNGDSKIRLLPRVKWSLHTWLIWLMSSFKWTLTS